MAELLVIFACFNQTGCQETSSQYYSQHPEIQEIVRMRENQIKGMVGPTVIQYWAPAMGAALGFEATARLSTRFYFTVKKDTQILMFKEEF